MRQHAWLNAAPEEKHAGKGEAPRAQSRLARYRKDGVEPSLPDPGPAGYLVEYLWEVGPTEPAGMGEAPVSHAQLAAWQANMGVELHAWEVQVLRRLSRDYVVQSHQAQDPACKPPFGELYRSPRVDEKIDAALD